ncbi:hypothetical protein ACFLT7_00685 [candidate division KSB1 bacterium]
MTEIGRRDFPSALARGAAVAALPAPLLGSTLAGCDGSGRQDLGTE